MLRITGLPQDAARSTVEDLQRILEVMRARGPLGGQASGPSIMPVKQIDAIISNTVAVMTNLQDRRTVWREAIANDLQDAQQRGADWQIEVDFYTAILALLDGQAPGLPGDHPYAPALRAIQEGIAAGGLQDEEDQEADEDDELPFDAELIPHSIAALAGGPQERMAHVQYLTEMSTSATDAGLKALFQVIQLALFGGNLSQVGQNLSGVYKEAWEMIVLGVEAGGVDPRLLSMIAQNTVAVFGPAAEQQGAWRDTLLQIKSDATEKENAQLVALVDAVIGLLDAGGKPEALGASLTGIYAQVWQAIEAYLRDRQK